MSTAISSPGSGISEAALASAARRVVMDLAFHGLVELDLAMWLSQQFAAARGGADMGVVEGKHQCIRFVTMAVMVSITIRFT